MKRQSGVTLLEMVIVVAIMGMIVLVMPALGGWLRQQGVSLAADQLRTDIQLARMMAIRNKRNCAVAIHSPDNDQYQNSLNRQWVSLAQFRGGVHFLGEGPDGRTAATKIVFNRQGMSTTVVPQDIFLADDGLRTIYRIRVMLPGGIIVQRWGKGRWL